MVYQAAYILFFCINVCATIHSMEKQVVISPTQKYATIEQYHNLKYREWHTPELQKAYQQLAAKSDKKPLEQLAWGPNANRYAQWLLADHHLKEKNQEEAKKYLIPLADEYRDAGAQLDLATLWYDRKEYWKALHCARRAALSRPMQDGECSIRYQSKQAVKLVELLELELIDLARDQSIEGQLLLVKQLTNGRQDNASIVYQKSLQLFEQILQRNELWDKHSEIIEEKSELTSLGKMLHSIVEKKFAEKKYADGVAVLERYAARGNNPLLIDLLAQGYRNLTRSLYDNYHLKAIELAERRLLETDHFESLCVLADALHLGDADHKRQVRRLKSTQPELAAKLRKQLAKSPLAVIDKIKKLHQIEQLPTVQEIDQLALQAIDLPVGIGPQDYRHFLKAFLHFCKAEYQLADAQYQTISKDAKPFFEPLVRWNSAIATKAVSDQEFLKTVNSCAETFAGRVAVLLDDQSTKPYAYLFLKQLIALTIDLLGEFRLDAAISGGIDTEWQTILSKNDEICARLLDRYASGPTAEPEHHVIQLLCHAFTEHSRRSIAADCAPLYLAPYVKKLKSRIDCSQKWEDERGLLLLLDAELSSGFQKNLCVYGLSELSAMMEGFHKLEKSVCAKLMNERKSSWHAILACNELVKIKDQLEDKAVRPKLHEIQNVFEKALGYDPADDINLNGYLYCLQRLIKSQQSPRLPSDLAKKFSEGSARARLCLASALIAESPSCRYEYQFFDQVHLFDFPLHSSYKRETGIKMLKELAQKGEIEAVELLGKCLYDLKRPEAIIFLKQAHDKGSRKYISCYADLLFQGKKYAETRKVLESRPQKNPQNYFLLGLLYHDQLGSECSKEKALYNLACGFEKNSIKLPTSIASANGELIRVNELGRKLLELIDDTTLTVSTAERDRARFAYACHLYWFAAQGSLIEQVRTALVKKADERMRALDQATYELPIALSKLIYQELRPKQADKKKPFGTQELDQIVEKCKAIVKEKDVASNPVAKDCFEFMVARLIDEYSDLFNNGAIQEPKVLASKHANLCALKADVIDNLSMEQLQKLDNLLARQPTSTEFVQIEKEFHTIFADHDYKNSWYLKLVSTTHLYLNFAQHATDQAVIQNNLNIGFNGMKESLQYAQHYAQKPEMQVRVKQVLKFFFETIKKATDNKQLDEKVAKAWVDEIEQLQSICYG